jgi:hypothetical protein
VKPWRTGPEVPNEPVRQSVYRGTPAQQGKAPGQKRRIDAGSGFAGGNTLYRLGAGGGIPAERYSRNIAADVYDLDIRRQGRLFRVGENRVQTRIFPIDYLHFKRSGGSETRVSSGQVTNARTGNAGNDNGSSQEGGASNLVGTRISTDTESDFWSDIDRALSMIVDSADGQQVIINPGAGLVMIRSRPQVLRQVEDYLTRTQLILQRQVILEAKILEVADQEKVITVGEFFKQRRFESKKSEPVGSDCFVPGPLRPLLSPERLRPGKY